mgnify:CR=1 FL=1
MKQLFLLSFFLISISVTSQSQRFYYDYQFQTDSTDLETKMSELMVLDIDKKGSKYYSEYVFQNDSIMDAQFKKNMAAHSDDPVPMSGKQGVVGYKILKSYPDFKINHIVSLDMTLYDSNQQVKINWKILSDKDKIGTWNVQKAEADFGGRKWIAWFSTDIPLQDGPYKFNGLPGLIVKIEDEGKNYSWELKGNRKVENFNEVTYLESISPGGNGGKVQEVSREKFDKTFNDFKKDPFASTRPLLKPEMLSQKMPGSDTTIGDMVKQQEKMLKDFYGANNNPIEIATPAVKGKK